MKNFVFKLRGFIKDLFRIRCKARTPRRKTVAKEKSGPNSLMGQPNPGPGRHQGGQISGQKDSEIKSGKLDTVTSGCH